MKHKMFAFYVRSLVALTAMGMFAAAPASDCADFAEVGEHTGSFVGVVYDSPAEGQSTWYYHIVSGGGQGVQAISHVTFALLCPEIQILDAGMWSGDFPDGVNHLSKAGKPEPGSFPSSPKSDPTTNVKGLKFDLGFDEDQPRNYYFTVDGNYAAEEITMAFKAGPGFETGLLCGPTGDCDESEVADERSSLGDFVWLDENEDGLQDPGEPGVAGVSVKLLTEAGDLLRTTQTDSDGFYLFDDLVEGTYEVQFVRPEGYLFTEQWVGGDSMIDSDADPLTGKSGPIALPPSTHDMTIDAGLIVSEAGLSLIKSGVYHPGTVDSWDTCTVFGPVGNFNALVFGDFSADGGDTDGRLGVGRNASIPTGYSVGYVMGGHPLPQYHGGEVDIFIVGMDLEDGQWGVNGNIVYGGERTGPQRWMANGNLLRRVNPVTIDEDGNVPSDGSGMSFAEIRARLAGRSLLLAEMADRGVVRIEEPSAHEFVLEGEDPDLNVFNVTAEQWSGSGRRIRIIAPEEATVLVNIHGESVDIHGGEMVFEGVDQERALLHFPDATLIELAAFAKGGSVLALEADGLFSGGSINGRAVFGGDVHTDTGFEFHNFYFEGKICFDELAPPTPPMITYTFTVENTGNVPLSDVWIDDPLVDVLGGPIDLDPGEVDSETFTATLVLTAALLAEGEFVNDAVAIGKTPSGSTVSAEDQETVVFPEPGEAGGSSVGTGSESVHYPDWMKPDFILTLLELNPTPVAPGQTFSATVVATNIGDRAGHADGVRVWSGLSGEEPEEPGEVSTDKPLGILEVGQSKTLTFTGLTAGETPGTLKVRAEVNPDGVTEEKSHGNNHLLDAYTIFDPEDEESAAWMKPDFVVKSVTLSPSPSVPNVRFKAVVRVANQGLVAGDAGELGFWQASPEYTSDLTAPELTATPGELDPGEHVDIPFEGLRAPDEKGTFHAMAVANWTGGTEEMSHGNNHAGATYTLHPVHLKVVEVEGGMELQWNSTAGFHYFVERSTGLDQSFTDIADNLPATPPVNTYVDTDPPEDTTVFYRVWGYKP